MTRLSMMTIIRLFPSRKHNLPRKFKFAGCILYLTLSTLELKILTLKRTKTSVRLRAGTPKPTVRLRLTTGRPLPVANHVSKSI